MTLPSGIAQASLHTVVSLGAGCVLAALSWFVSELPTPWRWSTFAAVSGLLLACPLLVPGYYLAARGLVAGIAVWWWVVEVGSTWAFGAATSVLLFAPLGTALPFS
jgi:hypothetical protein